MNNNIIYGFIYFFLGVIFIWFTRKYPTNKPDAWKLDTKGYMAGIGFILVGIGYLCVGFSHMK